MVEENLNKEKKPGQFDSQREQQQGQNIEQRGSVGQKGGMGPEQKKPNLEESEEE
jgi:hypothetical protein